MSTSSLSIVLGSSIVNTVNLFTGNWGTLIAGCAMQNPLPLKDKTFLLELHLSTPTDLNQLLPLLCGELMDIHVVGTIPDYMVHISASVASSQRQGPYFPSGVHVYGDSHRWSGRQRLQSDQRGQSEG